MNIYVKIELLHREIDGRLLLALVAAERGHRVLLGDLGSLLSHRRWLPPGVFHDKSLTPSQGKSTHHRTLAAAGFLVTSQDEEHGLLGEDYSEFLCQRYSEGTLGTAAAVMAWGPFDGDALRAAHPALAGQIHVTGSPRVDMWRPDVAVAYAGLPPEEADGRPYVLFCTNQLSQVPFWAWLRDTRPTYFRTGEDPASDMARGVAAEYTHAGSVIDAIRALRAARPDLGIVVRPHPAEDARAWSDLLAPIPDVVVTRRGGLGRWLRSAVAVVHNGSTSGLEAAVGGVPAVAYTPTGLRHDALVNRLGRAATSPDDLVARIDEAREPTVRSEWYAGSARELLRSRFAALDGRLAADRIVDVWESLDRSGLGRPFGPRGRLALATVHATVGSVRRRARGDASSPIDARAKFPADGLDEAELVRSRLAATLGRFAEVRLTRIGPRLALVEA